jgi:hypothetical protein
MIDQVSPCNPCTTPLLPLGRPPDYWRNWETNDGNVCGRSTRPNVIERDIIDNWQSIINQRYRAVR